jgi:predicted nucleotidyltransferase
LQTNPIEKIRQLISASAPAVLKTRPVLLSYLYGSCARGDVHAFSDIDIAVYLEEMAPPKMLDVELALALDFGQVRQMVPGLNLQRNSETD